jgi:putative hydrolase of the HAD superfamily
MDNGQPSGRTTDSVQPPVDRDHVEIVCLDAGGVLLFPNWVRVSGILATHGVVVSAEVLAEADLRARLTFDRGEVVGSTNNAGHARMYYEHVMAAAGLEDDEAVRAALASVRASHRERNLWETSTAEVSSAMRRMRGLGLRLLVVSNADGRLVELLERTGLAAFFDAAIDSHEVGVEKPDPRIFEIALARVDGRPERAVHVGDMYHVDVVGARAAGLTPVLLDPLDLQPEADCDRVRSLTELAERLS